LSFLKTLKDFLEEITSFGRKKILPCHQRNQFLTECVIQIISSGSLVIPFAFVIIFILEDADPYRRMFRDAFGITEFLQLKYIPLLLYIFFQVLQYSNAGSYLMSIPTLYCYSLNEWLVYLTTKALKSSVGLKPIKETSELNSIQDRVADIKLIRSYQVLQLLIWFLNSEIQKIWIGFHHATLLAVPVICFFFSIRWTDYMSKFTLLILVFAGVACVSIMFTQVLMWTLLPTKSAKFLRVMRCRNTRNSIMGRRIRASKLIQSGLGYPYYRLSKISFLIFMQQLLSFLATLLLSFE